MVDFEKAFDSIMAISFQMSRKIQFWSDFYILDTYFILKCKILCLQQWILFRNVEISESIKQGGSLSALSMPRKQKSWQSQYENQIR